MKGGQTPIHIMRWAAADYVNDPFVRRCYQKRDYRTAAFYPVFLFYCHIEGGDLPADVDELAAIVLMPPRDVATSLRVCKEAGKIQEQNGRVYHKRVKREVEAELEYRQHQAEVGKKGGRPKKRGEAERVAKGEPKASLLENLTPPASASAPSPAPAPMTPVPNGTVVTGRPDADDGSGAYVAAVLDLYCRLPGTRAGPTRADRRIAAELHRKGVPLEAAREGLLLATARRELRTHEEPLPPIGSLAYFLDAIEEARASPPESGYLDHLAARIEPLMKAPAGGEPTTNGATDEA